VLRRRPDARWGFCAEKLANLAELQSRILDGAAELVAPGGVLVYSTCSNEPEENAEQVEAFLARRRGFAAVASEESVPFESGMDGAFAAVLRRTPSV
jgi:16S rRNA (cytosine967-C5)-methyltransferase